MVVPGRLSFSGGLDFSEIIKQKIYILSVPINKYIKINIMARNDDKISVIQIIKKFFIIYFKNFKI